jgi:hypothetical protein
LIAEEWALPFNQHHHQGDATMPYKHDAGFKAKLAELEAAKTAADLQARIPSLDADLISAQTTLELFDLEHNT